MSFWLYGLAVSRLGTILALAWPKRAPVLLTLFTHPVAAFATHRVILRNIRDRLKATIACGTSGGKSEETARI